MKQKFSLLSVFFQFQLLGTAQVGIDPTFIILCIKVKLWNRRLPMKANTDAHAFVGNYIIFGS
ncbi:hypothetical protein SLEP1_g27482 [Rubroshorea leprosula]|uniref:Uncharacterized protein n=1 Tax=Rubroshorea leprosula TaxID=152421 RepID=A0AAV5JQK2_9ROSI|nr:hypothetical protein SLEP1_g27482 [Rubroshorea leprosula]